MGENDLCDRCKVREEGSRWELKGKYADDTRFLFVLHRPNHTVRQRSLLPCSSDYETALFGSITGRVIKELLNECGLRFDDVYITNFIQCVLNKEPVKAQYEACRTLFEKKVAGFKPKAIVLFGSEFYRYILPNSPKFNEAIHPLSYKGIPTLVSYHPSMLGTMAIREKDSQLEGIKKFLLPLMPKSLKIEIS